MSQQKWKYLMWFMFGMGADHFIWDAITGFPIPWRGTADQQGFILVAFIVLVLLTARAVAWMRQDPPPNSN
jgi:hypothetical protein